LERRRTGAWAVFSMVNLLVPTGMSAAYQAFGRFSAKCWTAHSEHPNSGRLSIG
jgi:hypothetical protein